MTNELPHPDVTTPEDFTLQVYRKLTEEGAIDSSVVNGTASSSDVTSLQDDVSTLESTVNATSTTLTELATTIAQLRLTDLSDFIVETRSTGITITLAGRIALAWEQIGTWNMDSSTSPSGWSHNLDISDRSNIRFISALIFNDSAGVTAEMLSQDSGSEITVTSSLIQAQRANGGPFDSTSYDDSSMNRGYFFVIFEPNS